MTTRSNVIIVGGGIIGLTTAYTLAKSGVPSIVLDQGELGKEASWAGAGILPGCDPASATTPLDRLRGLSVSRFAELSEELRSCTGIDNGFRVTGGLEFVDDDSPQPSEEWCGPGAACEALDAASIHLLEPALSHESQPVRRLPSMAQLRNPRHLQALVAACSSMLGSDGWPLVDLRPGACLTSLLRDGNRIEAVTTTNEVVSGEQFLISAGAWAGLLLKPLGITVPITPVRGQIVLLNPGPPLVRHILLCGSRYLVPRAEGRILVGSTEEHAGFQKHTTAAGVEGLLDFAIRLVPDLAAAAVEKSWAGLRPGSRDGLPYLGRVGEFNNLYLAAGHFRAGVQLSIGTAMVMAALLTKQSPPMEFDAFALDR
jgi:glycine oxidase